MQKVIFLFMALSLVGCTTATKITGEKGQKEMIIACGTAVNLTVCHKRAAKECPNGYKTIMASNGFNARELHIRCN